MYSKAQVKVEKNRTTHLISPIIFSLYISDLYSYIREICTNSAGAAITSVSAECYCLVLSKHRNAHKCEENRNNGFHIVPILHSGQKCGGFLIIKQLKDSSWSFVGIAGLSSTANICLSPGEGGRFMYCISYKEYKILVLIVTNTIALLPQNVKILRSSRKMKFYCRN